MNSPAARATQERPNTAAARTRCDVTGPGEVVYIIEGDSQVRERLFTELTASGVAVQSFDPAPCAGVLDCSGRSRISVQAADGLPTVE
jgi:hypothetical protein